MSLNSAPNSTIQIRYSKIHFDHGSLCGFAYSYCTLNGKIYMFGGGRFCIKVQGEQWTREADESNELLIFNPTPPSIDKVKLPAPPEGTAPCSRAGSAMAAIGSRLFLFGGLSQRNCWLNDLLSFDIETNQWSLIEATGHAPSPRDKLAGHVVGDRFYIFGGFGPDPASSGNGEIAGQMAAIHSAAQSPPAGLAAAAASGTGAADANGEEGEDDDEAEEADDDENEDEPDDQEPMKFIWFNDLCVFDSANKSWSQPMHLSGPDSVPEPRAGHGMCGLHNGRQLAIFGGRTTDGRTNELYFYDTVTRKWHQSNRNSNKKEEGVSSPPAKQTKLDHSHSTNVSGDAASSAASASGSGVQSARAPSGRSMHSLVCFKDRYLVAFGGLNQEEDYLNDLHVYDTETNRWLRLALSQVEAEGGSVKLEEERRAMHAAGVLGDRLYVLGGHSTRQGSRATHYLPTMRCFPHALVFQLDQLP